MMIYITFSTACTNSFKGSKTVGLSAVRLDAVVLGASECKWPEASDVGGVRTSWASSPVSKPPSIDWSSIVPAGRSFWRRFRKFQNHSEGCE